MKQRVNNSTDFASSIQCRQLTHRERRNLHKDAAVHRNTDVTYYIKYEISTPTLTPTPTASLPPLEGFSTAADTDQIKAFSMLFKRVVELNYNLTSNTKKSESSPHEFSSIYFKYKTKRYFIAKRAINYLKQINLLDKKEKSFIIHQTLSNIVDEVDLLSSNLEHSKHQIITTKNTTEADFIKTHKQNSVVYEPLECLFIHFSSKLKANIKNKNRDNNLFFKRIVANNNFNQKIHFITTIEQEIKELNSSNELIMHTEFSKEFFINIIGCIYKTIHKYNWHIYRLDAYLKGIALDNSSEIWTYWVHNQEINSIQMSFKSISENIDLFLIKLESSITQYLNGCIEHLRQPVGTKWLDLIRTYENKLQSKLKSLRNHPVLKEITQYYSFITLYIEIKEFNNHINMFFEYKTSKKEQIIKEKLNPKNMIHLCNKIGCSLLTLIENYLSDIYPQLKNLNPTQSNPFYLSHIEYSLDKILDIQKRLFENINNCKFYYNLPQRTIMAKIKYIDFNYRVFLAYIKNRHSYPSLAFSSVIQSSVQNHMKILESLATDIENNQPLLYNVLGFNNINQHWIQENKDIFELAKITFYNDLLLFQLRNPDFTQEKPSKKNHLVGPNHYQCLKKFKHVINYIWQYQEIIWPHYVNWPPLHQEQ